MIIQNIIQVSENGENFVRVGKISISDIKQKVKHYSGQTSAIN